MRADPALGTFLAGRSAWGAGGIVLLAAASLAGTFSNLLRGGAGRRGDGEGSGAASSSASSSLLPSLLTPSPALRPRLGSDDTSRSDRSDLFHDAVEYLEEGLLSPSPSPSPSPSRFSTPASGDGGLRERNASTPSRPGSALRRTSRGTTVPPPPSAPSGTAEAQASARGAAARGAAALHLGCGAAVGLAETAVPLWLLAPRSLGGLGLGQGPAAVLGAGAALLVAGLARLAGPGAPLAPVMGNEGIARGPRRAAGFPPLRRLRIGSGLLVLAPLLLLVPPSPPEGSGSASSGIPSPSLYRAAAFLTLLAASLCMCLEAAADARSLVLGGRAGGGSCGGSTGPSPTPPPPPPPPLLGGEALGCAFGGVLLCRTSLPGLAVGTGAAILGLALHLGSYCLVPAGGGGELLLLPPSTPGGGGSRGHQPQGRGSLVAELLAIPLGDARALLGLLPCGAWGRRRGGVRFRGAKHMFRRPEGV